MLFVFFMHALATIRLKYYYMFCIEQANFFI
jgi:hypothetical protein